MTDPIKAILDRRRVALKALSDRMSDAVNLTMPCPSCDHRGPHESNGLRGEDHDVLCVKCGEQWAPEGYRSV